MNCPADRGRPERCPEGCWCECHQESAKHGGITNQFGDEEMEEIDKLHDEIFGTKGGKK